MLIHISIFNNFILFHKHFDGILKDIKSLLVKVLIDECYDLELFVTQIPSQYVCQTNI